MCEEFTCGALDTGPKYFTHQAVYSRLNGYMGAGLILHMKGVSQNLRK